MCPPPSKWDKFFPIRYRHTNIHIIHINIWVFPIKIPGFPFWSHDSDGSMVEPLLFALLRPGCTPKLCTPREPTVLQKDTCVRIRLTQSRLEMALSSVNPPSSYRLKQTGDIGEDRESPSLCARGQSAKSMHVLTVQCEKSKQSHASGQDCNPWAGNSQRLALQYAFSSAMADSTGVKVTEVPSLNFQ